MTNWKSVNVNTDVRFKLNDTGRAAHIENFKERYRLTPSFKYTPLKEGPDGWITMRMWEFMQEMGPLISSAASPFETQIEIDFGS